MTFLFKFCALLLVNSDVPNTTDLIINLLAYSFNSIILAQHVHSCVSVHTFGSNRHKIVKSSISLSQFKNKQSVKLTEKL